MKNYNVSIWHLKHGNFNGIGATKKEAIMDCLKRIRNKLIEKELTNDEIKLELTYVKILITKNIDKISYKEYK